MSIIKITSTRDEWLESVFLKSKSIPSMDTYRYGIKAWDDFLLSKNQNDMEILAEFKEGNNKPETYLYLNQFVQFMIKRGLKRKTIDLSFAALRSWCASNGVMLFNEYIKSLVKMPKEIREMKMPLDHDEIKALIINSPNQIKVVLLVLLSSGMRISEVLQVRVKEVNHSTNPIEIRVRAETAKTREERIAYISDEAWQMVKPLLNNKEETDLVFIPEYKRTSLISFETRFARVRKNVGLIEKYDDDVHYHVNIHAFRANFMTLATKILDGDTAHALLGHRKYLDVYFRLSQQEKATLYHKLEPYLTVSDEARQRGIINEKDKQIQELSKMRDELDKQKAKIKRLEKLS